MPERIYKKGNQCTPICSDGTEYGSCSKEKPKFCYNGTLVNRASECGCPYEYTAQDEDCVSIYKIGPKNVTFSYVLNGKWNSFSYTVFNGLNQYLYSLPRSITYSQYENPPTSKDFALRDLDNEKQKEFLDEFVNRIEKETDSEDDRVRIAISLVQNIPYDTEGVKLGNLHEKYPYEVLYTNAGVCSEKSELLAYILRKNGLWHGALNI